MFEGIFNLMQIRSLKWTFVHANYRFSNEQSMFHSEMLYKSLLMLVNKIFRKLIIFSSNIVIISKYWNVFITQMSFVNTRSSHSHTYTGTCFSFFFVLIIISIDKILFLRSHTSAINI